MVSCSFLDQFAYHNWPMTLRKKSIVSEKKKFIKAAEALGVTKFRLIFVDVLWFSCKDILFSRSMNLFLAAIAIEIFKTYYICNPHLVPPLGTLLTQIIGLTIKARLSFLCMVFFSFRWFTERLIYDDGVTYG